MTKPKAEKPYLLVRSSEGCIEHTTYTRYSDGSADFVTDGFVHCYELRPDAWKKALVDLQAMGFVELHEAESSGLVPLGWTPE
jgi:hypothetical protein